MPADSSRDGSGHNKVMSIQDHETKAMDTLSNQVPSTILPSSIFSQASQKVTPFGKYLTTQPSSLLDQDHLKASSSTTSLLRHDLHGIKEEHLHKHLVKNLQEQQRLRESGKLTDLDRYSLKASQANSYFPAPRPKKTAEAIFEEERMKLGLSRRHSPQYRMHQSKDASPRREIAEMSHLHELDVESSVADNHELVNLDHETGYFGEDLS